MSIGNVLVLALLVLIALCAVIWFLRRPKRVATPRTHGPLGPGSGYDPAEITRSKEAGRGYHN